MVFRRILFQILIPVFFLGRITTHEFKESRCNSFYLNQLGCLCISETTINNFMCSNKINELNCIFKENILNRTQFVNYYDYVIQDLTANGEENNCWSQFYFENVHKISSGSLGNLKFSSNKNQSSVLIWFRNVVEVDSYAFQNIEPYNEQSSIIRLQSGPLSLRNKSFSNITRCKALELTNFVDMQTDIRTSFFSNSDIENLVISYTNFKGFISDADTQLENIQIRNIIIDSCFIKIINYQTIGKFHLLEGLQIKKSGLSLINGQVFENCCKSIQKLFLDNNLIEIIEYEIFSGLSSLNYLNLESNPIQYIEKGAFDSMRQSLRKLNLKSTNVISLEDSYFAMSSIKELILTDTRKLESENINVILTNSPHLQYLALDESKIVKSFPNLNYFFDEFEFNLPYNFSLKYLDVSTYGVELDENLFKNSFNVSKNCLWSKLLEKTFIKVDSNHPCNCALLYIYRNITKFNFPFVNSSILTFESDLSRPYLHDYFKIRSDTKTASVWEWKEILQLLPKCYTQLLLESFDFSSINHLETKCGLWEEDNFNCTEVTRTTALPTMPTSFRNSTEDISTTKTISSPYMVPVLISLLVFSLVIIFLSVLKTKKKFSTKLQNSSKHSLTGLPQLPKEMDSILTFSPEENFPPSINQSKL